VRSAVALASGEVDWLRLDLPPLKHAKKRGAIGGGREELVQAEADWYRDEEGKPKKEEEGNEENRREWNLSSMSCLILSYDGKIFCG
jgi:hypothetical protein